jgi:hypothetical protein
MIDEANYRLESFKEDRCTWVTFSDGGRWALARPYLTVHPMITQGVPTGSWNYFSYGNELDAHLEAISQTDDLVITIIRTVALASLLLRQSYDIPDEVLAQIVLYRVNDPTSTQLLRDVINVATGGLFELDGRGVLDDPKPQPGG